MDTFDYLDYREYIGTLVADNNIDLTEKEIDLLTEEYYFAQSSDGIAELVPDEELFWDCYEKLKARKESAKEADANEQRYKDELPDLGTIDYYERLKRERQKVNSVLDEEEDFDFEELDPERVMKL